MFTNTARSPKYTFSQLNTGDYGWALITQALVSGYGTPGLDTWVSLLGGSRHITSGFRNPRHNAGVGGIWNSRHMYGDAVDLQNVSQTRNEYDTLAAAAHVAGALYIELPNGPCRMLCVHADWRGRSGPYKN
jgi:hypothetical protein